MKKPCPFCGTDGPLSNEHIIPQWLLNALGIRNLKIVTTHMATFGGVMSRRGPMELSNFVNGRICESCNNGWMSRLEAEVKPLIEALINLDSSVLDRLKPLSESVARWCLKTALVLNHQSNYRRLAPLTHYREVCASVMPNGITVNIGVTHDDSEFRFRQGQTAMVIGPAKEVKRAATKAYKITFQFRHLLVRTAYFPLDGYVLEDNSIYLWPVFGRPDDLTLFEDIDDFDLSGGFIPGKWNDTETPTS